MVITALGALSSAEAQTGESAERGTRGQNKRGNESARDSARPIDLVSCACIHLAQQTHPDAFPIKVDHLYR